MSIRHRFAEPMTTDDHAHLRYRIDPARRCAMLAVSGPATVDDLMALVRAVWDDPAWDPACAGVADLSAARLELEPGGMARLWRELAPDPRSLRGRLALVITTPLETAHAALLAQVASAEREIGLFYRLENALRYVSAWPPGDDAPDWVTLARDGDAPPPVGGG